MRAVLQRLSRDLVLKRRLPRRFGGAPIFVSPDASLRFWRPTLDTVDPKLFDTVTELVRPGDVVWDVGANVGLFSFSAAFAAGPTGRVVALEPDPFLANLLGRSAAALPEGYAPVAVLPVAVSDEVGLDQLSIAGQGRASNTLGFGMSQLGGLRRTQTALCLTLDWLLQYLPPPDVLKIDVEGVEGAVLRGASAVLATARPRIHSEMATQAAFDLLKAHAYTLYNADEPPASRQELHAYAFHTVAFPPAPRPARGAPGGDSGENVPPPTVSPDIFYRPQPDGAHVPSVLEIPLTGAQFAALGERLKQSGLELTGDAGTVSAGGIKANYLHANGALRITILEKPFLLPERVVQARLRAFVEQTLAAR